MIRDRIVRNKYTNVLDDELQERFKKCHVDGG